MNDAHFAPKGASHYFEVTFAINISLLTEREVWIEDAARVSEARA